MGGSRAGARADRRNHAVVVGGSIAGLTAARVLAECFDRVTVIDRDRLPDGPAPRPGTPQARHFHALLAEGLARLDELFPGFDDELAAAGCLGGDAAADVAYHMATGWAPRFRSGIIFRGASRGLIESILRRRVRALGNVVFLEETRATGLIRREAGAVSGVRVVAKGASEEVAADLVVDAAGRNSRAPDWLREIGYRSPRETVLDPKIAYASRRYVRKDDTGWTALLVLANRAGLPRYGGIYPEEGGRWVVCLAGAAGHVPPSDDEGFLAFARSLDHPAVYEAIAAAEPLTPVSAYRDTGNRLRHFRPLGSWPERFIVVGDAAGAFNPIYGQGMTLAVLAACALGSLLAERDVSSARFAHAFQQRIAVLMRIPWLLATSEDLRYAAEAPALPLSRVARFYTARLLDRVPSDETVAAAFLRVLHMVEPKAILAPAIVARGLLPRQRRLAGLSSTAPDL